MGNFYTDVIKRDDRFYSIQRIDDVNLLEPVTRQLITGVLEEAKHLGFDMMIFETYRSRARQQMLFYQRATQHQEVSVHHYGLACDIVKRVGNEPSWKGDFSFVGRLAIDAGLIWGGDWGEPDRQHSFIDQPHLQRCTIARQGALFAGTWYPSGDYNPYDQGSTSSPTITLSPLL
jgi:hypothetical protein